MEEKKNTRDPRACKAIMDLHLAKFNYYMAKKDWKAAITELQHALNAVIDILEHANKTLKKVAERYQHNKDKGLMKIRGSVRTERLSEDTVLIEYPGNKIVLKKV